MILRGEPELRFKIPHKVIIKNHKKSKPRETEKHLLIHLTIGGKQTSGSSPGGKDQKDLEGSLKVFSQDGHGVMIFSCSKVSHSRWSSYFVCDGRCTHTHLLLAHFLRTSRSLHIFMRVTHAWLKVMKNVFVACACRLSWFLSCFARLRLLFLHGHFETNFTDAPVHTILPNFPGPKARVKRTPHEDEQFGYLATSVLLTGYEPKEFDKITSVDVDTPPINDPDHNISDFSKTTSENTGHSVLNPLFCTFLIGDFALQRESKESMPRETVARQRKRGKRRFCDQRCRVGVKEMSTEQY